MSAYSPSESLADFEDFKTKLKTLKKTLKEYEHNFLNSNGRKPGKEDIASNVVMSKQYKLYAKLKTLIDQKNQENELETAQISQAHSDTVARSSISNLTSPRDSSKNSDADLYSPETPLKLNMPVYSNEPELPEKVIKFKPRKSSIATGILSNQAHISVKPILAQNVSAPSEQESEMVLATFRDDVKIVSDMPNSVGYDEYMSKRREIENLGKTNAPVETLPIPKLEPISVPQPVLPSDPIPSPKKEVRICLDEQPPQKPVVKPEEPVIKPKLKLGWDGDLEKEVDGPASPPAETPRTRSILKKVPKKFEEPVESEVPPPPISKEEKEIPPPRIEESHESLTTSTHVQESTDALKLNVPEDVIGVGEDSESKPVTSIASANLKPILLLTQVFLRLPKEGVLRCRIYRKSNLLDKAYPSFYMHNDADNSFILFARKRKKSPLVNYVISDSLEETSKDSVHYLARLRANFGRTNFVLSDARGYKKSNADAPMRELAHVSYTKNVLPRVLTVVIPNSDLPDNDGKFEYTDIQADMKTRNTDKWMFLRNKPPRWNENTQSHCLNFGGRVTQPSVKNMQLISEGDDGIIFMQFGRCGPDEFSLDVRWPMTPLEAFGIALSTFDAYDGN